MAPAAHRGILQYICSDTHKLALWLSPTSFVDNAAYPQTLGQIACAPPAPKHPLYTRGRRKSVQRLRHCAPNNLIIMLNLDGVCASALELYGMHRQTHHMTQPPHGRWSSGVLTEVWECSADVGHAL